MLQKPPFDSSARSQEIVAACPLGKMEVHCAQRHNKLECCLDKCHHIQPHIISRLSFNSPAVFWCLF